jgi:RNA polymerase sigma-70 factor (ECF subfamily)
MVATTYGDAVPPATLDSFVAGDEAALAEIYARWSSLVYSVARSSLGNVNRAEELTQRVFVRAWRSRHTFDPARAKLAAWLIRITQDELAEAHTTGAEQAPVRTEGTTMTQRRDESDLSDLAGRLVLADEVSRLTAVQQQVMRLALSDGLTHTAIAERLGLSADVVKSQLRRSLLGLRERLTVVRDAY